MVVIARKSDKSSIDGYGAPDEFLNKISSLFGTQVFKGEHCLSIVGCGWVHAMRAMLSYSA